MECRKILTDGFNTQVVVDTQISQSTLHIDESGLHLLSRMLAQRILPHQPFLTSMIPLKSLYTVPHRRMGVTNNEEERIVPGFAHIIRSRIVV